MAKRWLDAVRRDPVPWLLDPVNPSVRLLALRDIFNKPQHELAEEYPHLWGWALLQDLLSHWDRFNFWGRALYPYYGGPLGNFGTLYLLAQMGAPRCAEVEPVCESLLNHGRRTDGCFAPEDSPAAPWLCYTGIALRTLWHFGYGDDLRWRSALEALLSAILVRPALLKCPVAGGDCQSGWVKALGALLSIPSEQRSDAMTAAIQVLAEKLLGYGYDFKRAEATWMTPTFPRYYEADLIEVCRMLAQTVYCAHPRLLELVELLLTLQDEAGRWCRLRNTPVLLGERIAHPSRWLTFEAVHALILVYGGNAYAS